MLDEFKKFIMRGNVVDMAVGIVIGAAFGAIISSFVANILMPPIGLLLGGVDFQNLLLVLKKGVPAGPYNSLSAAQAAGAVSLNYGLFVNVVINFLIIAFALFMVVKGANSLKEKPKAQAPSTKECPFCVSTIAIKATRCSNCTSQL